MNFSPAQHTLSLATIIYSVMIALSILVFGYLQRGIKGMFYLAFASLFVGGGFILILNRVHLPVLFSVIIANGLIVAGIILLIGGVMRFNGKSIPAGRLLGALAAFLAVMSFFTFVRDDLALRIIVTGLFVTALVTLAGFLIISYGREHNDKTGLIVLMSLPFLIIGLINLGRPLFVLIRQKETGFDPSLLMRFDSPLALAVIAIQIMIFISAAGFMVTASHRAQRKNDQDHNLFQNIYPPFMN